MWPLEQSTHGQRRWYVASPGVSRILHVQSRNDSFTYFDTVGLIQNEAMKTDRMNNALGDS